MVFRTGEPNMELPAYDAWILAHWLAAIQFDLGDLEMNTEPSVKAVIRWADGDRHAGSVQRTHRAVDLGPNWSAAGGKSRVWYEEDFLAEPFRTAATSSTRALRP